MVRTKKAKAGTQPVAPPAPPPAPAPLPAPVPALSKRLAVYGVDNSLIHDDDPFTDIEQREWLDRSMKWPDLAEGTKGFAYLPVKVLGGGNHGTVGLWTLKSRRKFGVTRPKRVTRSVAAATAANDVDDLFVPPPQHLVIKQAVGGREMNDARLNMQWESKLLRQIMTTETEHVVKIYKGFHLDDGSGTNAIRDPAPFVDDETYREHLRVCRIYLEYCGGGAMNSFVGQWKGGKVPEENIWRIMLCIFKGLLVLERGQEDAADPPPALNKPWGNPIAHFDIKPDNILIGTRDDSVHERLEIFKLGDFGLAMKVPTTHDELAGEKWINEAFWRKTPSYAPPEQFFKNHNERDKITAMTGVWSTAATIYELCCDTLVDQNDTFMDLGNELTSGDPGELLNKMKFPYSDRLMRILRKCLAWNPSGRPSIPGLVRSVQAVVDAYDTVQREIPDDLLYNFDEPNVVPPGSSGKQVGGTRILMKVQEQDNTVIYVRGNEPQPNASPNHEPRFFFPILKRTEGASPKSNKLRHKPLYKLPAHGVKIKVAAPKRKR